MSTRDERYNSFRILNDSAFHRMMLEANLLTIHLAAAVEGKETVLRLKFQGHETALLGAFREEAKSILSKHTLDEALISAELDILKAVKRNRTSPIYKAIFHVKLADIIAESGAEEEGEVRNMVSMLQDQLPSLGASLGPNLITLAETATTAHTTFKTTENAAQLAFQEELAARTVLVEQLKIDEGLLIAIFPRQKKLVRKFFRQLPPKKTKPTTTTTTTTQTQEDPE
jgi:hypothetical protein